MKNSEYRFSIGAKNAAVSSAWKVWNRKDDIYLVVRGSSAPEKFSFHASGRCRWALLDPPSGGQDRAFLKWVRDDITSLKAGDGVLLLRLVFPTNHLSEKFPDHSDGVEWISPAPVGKAIAVEFVITKGSRDEILGYLADGERVLRSHMPLPNGFTFIVVSSEFDCGPVVINMPGTPVQPGQVFGDLEFPDVDLKKTGRPIRLLMSSGEGMPPNMYELGGYQTTPLATLLLLQQL